jgi:2-hydroxy-3-keto-5-methylthiopentenyl-1-phosphate phosphatase
MIFNNNVFRNHTNHLLQHENTSQVGHDESTTRDKLTH